MEVVGIPIIILICYMAGEIYKVIFVKNSNMRKLIPIFVIIVGGIMGVILYETDRKMILNVDSIWNAIYIGMCSGASSTSTNQIIKQIITRKGENKNE